MWKAARRYVTPIDAKTKGEVTPEALDVDRIPFKILIGSQTGMHCGVCSSLTSNCKGCEVKYKDKPPEFKRNDVTLVLHFPGENKNTYYVPDKAEVRNTTKVSLSVVCALLLDCSGTNNAPTERLQRRLGGQEPLGRQVRSAADAHRLPAVLHSDGEARSQGRVVLSELQGARTGVQTAGAVEGAEHPRGAPEALPSRAVEHAREAQFDGRLPVDRV